MNRVQIREGPHIYEGYIIKRRFIFVQVSIEGYKSWTFIWKIYKDIGEV